MRSSAEIHTLIGDHSISVQISQDAIRMYQSEDLVPMIGSGRAVQKTLEKLSPSVELAKKKYIEAHDAVVQAPSYDKAFNAASTGISKVASCSGYKP